MYPRILIVKTNVVSDKDLTEHGFSVRRYMRIGPSGTGQRIRPTPIDMIKVENHPDYVRSTGEKYGRAHWCDSCEQYTEWSQGSCNNCGGGAGDDGGFAPNGSSQLEWVKSDGVDRDGHSLTWWKNKTAKWKSSGRRPTIEVRVTGYLSNGQRGESFEFGPDELTEAKAKAKQWTQSTNGSALVGVIVDVPYEGMVRFDIGEWRFTGARGYFVWQVDSDQMPIDSRGPIADPDEAYKLARDQARTAAAGTSFVVSWGGDPEMPDFEIIKAWKGWAAEVHTLGEYPKLGRRLRELKR